MPRPTRPAKSRRWPVIAAAFLAMALAIGVAGAVALTGFSTTGFTMAGVTVPAFSVGPTAQAAPTSGDGALGRCWQGTRNEATTWTVWEGGEPVPCAGDHSLYTFAVEKLAGTRGAAATTEGDPPEIRPGAPDGAPDGASDSASDETSDGAPEGVAKECDAALALLLPGRSWKQQRISAYSFLPTEAEWAAGQRWVRCDVGVLAIGSARDSPEFGSLPGDIQTLVDDLANNPAKYYYCVALPGGAMPEGPFSAADAVIADCDDEPAWRLTGTQQLAGAAGTAYPSRETILALAQDACGTTSDWLAAGSTTRGWVDYPSEDMWRDGSRQADCWLEGEG